MNKILLFCLMLTFFVSSSCKKEDKQPKNTTTKLFTFNSLESEHNEINQGNVTRITAKVTGEATYEWTCSSGDLFGSGNSILFGAGSCCKGDHYIYCNVKDKNNNSESKSILIKVN